MDSAEEEDRQAQRRKRTLYLVVGGVLSLVLPLLGLIYFKLSETQVFSGNVDPNAVFARREGLSARIQPAGAPAAPSSPPGAAAATGTPLPVSQGAESGLSMIRGGNDYYQEKTQPTPTPAPAPVKPPPVAPPAAPAKTAAATGPQPFSMAHLKATGLGDVRSWFSGGSPRPSSAPGRPQAQAQGTQQAPNINALLNAAPGASGTATGVAPAVPDINALLKNMPNPASNSSQQ